MREENMDFLINNGIMPDEVCSKVDCNIYSQKQINPIIAKYRFYTEPQKEMISIADVVGYDTRGDKYANIYESLDRFFDEEGNQFSTRSLGMLGYTTNNVMKEFEPSFQTRPISLVETGEGSYTIYGDGRHRFTILRALYLSEVAKAGGDKEKLKELAKKYTIPAIVRGIDLDKTYCKYLLRKVKRQNDGYDILDIETEYDKKDKQTGNVTIIYANGQKESLSNELLLMLTKERVLEDNNFSRHNRDLQRAYDRCPSFRDFMDAEFSDIIPLKKNEEKGVDFDD